MKIPFSTPMLSFLHAYPFYLFAPPLSFPFLIHTPSRDSRIYSSGRAGLSFELYAYDDLLRPSFRLLPSLRRLTSVTSRVRSPKTQDESIRDTTTVVIHFVQLRGW